MVGCAVEGKVNQVGAFEVVVSGYGYLVGIYGFDEFDFFAEFLHSFNSPNMMLCCLTLKNSVAVWLQSHGFMWLRIFYMGAESKWHLQGVSGVWIGSFC